MTTEPSRETWWVVDHDEDDRRLRGPFLTDEAAAAVRREMERHHPYDVRGNLWIVQGGAQ